MAYFEELLVQGIRSYSTEKQTAFRFLEPVTIIQGTNGSGKTTLIEALCAITTGALPSGQKETFIHNLEVCRSTKVDAMVKLRFRDKQEQEVIATMRMTSTSAGGGKAKNRSDESTIKVIGQEERALSISSKVSDFNKEMLNLLGIPKAILENVIFCHQENSTWPLSEPAKLKAKFDDIFNLTKYVKFVEQLNKKIKACKTNLQLAETEANGASRLNEERIQKIERQEQLTSQIQSLKNKDEELRKSLEEEARILEEAEEKLLVFRELVAKNALARERLKGLENSRRMLSVPEFAGTERELRLLIQDMDNSADLRSAVEEKLRIENRLRVIEEELDQKLTLKRETEQQLAQAKASEMHRVAVQGRLNDQLRGMQRRFSIRSRGNVKDEMKEIERRAAHEWENKKKIIEDSINDFRSTKEAKEQALIEAKIELRNLSEGTKKLEMEKASLEKRIRDAKNSHKDVARMKGELARLEIKREKISIVAPSEEAVRQLREQRKTLSDQMEGIRSSLEAASHWESVRKERARLEQQKASEEARLTDIRAKLSKDFTSIFGSPLTGHIGEKVTSATARLKGGVDVAQQKWREAEMAADRAASAVDSLRKERAELAEQEEELKENIKLATNECDEEDVEWRLQNIRSDITRVRSELAPLEAKGHLYGEWAKQTKAKKCCPLCERNFSNNKGVETLAQKLSNLTMELPSKSEELSRQLEAGEKEEKEFVKAVSFLDTLKGVRRRIGEKSTEIEEGVREHEQKEEESAKRKTAVDSVAALLDSAHRMKADASLHDSLLDSVEKAARELAEGEDEWKEEGEKATASYAEMTEHLASLKDEFEDVNTEMEKLEASVSSLNDVNAQINEAKERIFSLGEEEQLKSHLEETLQKTARDMEEKTLRMADIQKELPVLSQKTERARMAMSEKEEEMREAEKAAARQINEARDELAKYSQLAEEFSHLSAALPPCDLESRVSELSRELQELMSRAAASRQELQNVGQKQTKRRELEDQLQLFALKKQITEVEKEVADTSYDEEELMGCREKKVSCEKARSSCALLLAEIKGKLESIQIEAKQIKLRLSEATMKKAESQLVSAVIKKVVFEGSIKDLEGYARRMEKCMIEFHQEKMEAVNGIIDDLWRQSYRSNDIESIRILSEQPQLDGKKKMYNYRVLMRMPGGLEVDMRDRCSAGQKMLACLIIRLALADVFGSSCSTIALDEPTTNLDIEKIDAMADMISDLIRARSSKHNEEIGGRKLQMIIITHDSKFVDRIRLACRPEYIYRVFKDDVTNCSTLSRVYTDGREGASVMSEELQRDVEEGDEIQLHPKKVRKTNKRL